MTTSGATTKLTDDDLLCRMLDGDEDAFSVLYRRHQGGLYRFALQMTGNSGTAEDVMQEAFMTLIREARRFDPEKGSLKAFLYGIGRNYALRHIEREREYTPLSENHSDGNGSGVLGRDLGPQPDLLADLTRSEAIDQVRSAVLALPANYREVVILCDLHEMGYSEAATILGCAVGTIRSRLHRARGLLVAKLRSSGNLLLTPVPVALPRSEV
jgi:RNA polymerase sigma-70 factor (ECF subfamily)